MSGLMTAFAGAGGSTAIINVTSATGINNTIYFYYGWSDSGFTAPPPTRQLVPDTAIGSATGSKIINGVSIIGVYSTSTTGTGTATSYIVAVAGNQTGNPGLISTVVINGTTVSGGAKTVDTYNSCTYFSFAVTSGPTVLTATSTVVIS